jgi:hypothetical protein
VPRYVRGHAVTPQDHPMPVVTDVRDSGVDTVLLNVLLNEGRHLPPMVGLVIEHLGGNSKGQACIDESI